MPSQCWALTVYMVEWLLLLSTFLALGALWEAHDVLVLPQCTMVVNSPLTSLHCFLSKAIRSLDSLTEGLLMKNFDYLIPGAAAQCLECLSISHSLTMSLPTHAKIEIAGSGQRNGQLNPYLTEASTSSPWIPVTNDPEEQNLVPTRQGTQCLSTFPEKLLCYLQCFKGLQCCLAEHIYIYSPV
jgi:hypothetical protein